MIAAALIVCPVAEAYSVNVSGLAPWQTEMAVRSLTAVTERLPSGQSDEVTERIMSVVAGRLFSGYKVESVRSVSQNITLVLSPSEDLQPWSVDFRPPNLQGPPAEWFNADVEKVRESVAALVNKVPVASLSWCDSGLKKEMLAALKPALPGWEPSIMVRTEEDRLVMQVSFTPEMPLVIAVTPNFSSNTLPTLLHGELKKDIIVQTAPFIGLPVAWASVHTQDMNKWATDYLGQRTLVERASAMPRASFSAGQISNLNVRVESSRYYVNAWAAVYAGTSDRTAELGLHLGRIIQLVPHWDMEVYGEGIVELQDWEPEGRLGVRWSPWGDVWLGGEWSSEDNMWWGRFNIEPRLHKPYAWLRIREDGEVNTAIGWKATDYISLELHYDSRDDDRWSLRMLGNL